MVAATGVNGTIREMTMAEKIPLSVAIITKDEEANLPGCLKSVAFARQIVVVDSGSADGTLEIARDFGCDVFTEPWKGFGPQKQMAIDRCREPWVLVLDADERIPPETEKAIRQVVSGGEGGAPGYSFPRKNFFQGRWIRHMGWWPDRITRLFRNGKGRMTEAAVHEAVDVAGQVALLDAPIEHYTESRLSEILKRSTGTPPWPPRRPFGKGADPRSGGLSRGRSSPSSRTTSFVSGFSTAGRVSSSPSPMP